MNRLMVLGILVWMGIALHAQSLYPDFSKLNFGCDGNSITAGEQWSKTVVDKLGFATHHNVAVGSATWACHPDTQDYGSEAFAGISGGWQVTEDKHELQMRHNNVSKVHIQKFIAEVESGAYSPSRPNMRKRYKRRRPAARSSLSVLNVTANLPASKCRN